MTTLSFTGWESGFQAVTFVKLLMDAGWPLKEAKEATDGLLEGCAFYLPRPTAAEAEQLLARARCLSAVGSIA